MAKKAGRPTGSKTQDIPRVEVAPSRCPNCGSAEREDYSGTQTLDYSGERDGVPFTRVVSRRTKCLSCGQARFDKSYE